MQINYKCKHIEIQEQIQYNPRMSELIGNTSENVYNGKPLRLFEGRHNSAPVSLAIHPNLSRRIVINVPGTKGVIDGYAQKYKILGHYIQSVGLAAVVRTGNNFDNYPADINLNAALAYAKQHAWEICGEPKPEILLMGFSAGASAIAARAHQHPEVTRILLGAPAKSMRGINVKEGMSKFKGEVYIVIGDKDDNVGTDSGKTLYNWATVASHKKLFVLPDCDHQFKGEKNGRIISQAPFYAFGIGEKPFFPNPFGGIKLYD